MSEGYSWTGSTSSDLPSTPTQENPLPDIVREILFLIFMSKQRNLVFATNCSLSLTNYITRHFQSFFFKQRN